MAMTHEWTHHLSKVIMALLDAGLWLEWYFAEHDSLAWQLWPCLQSDGKGCTGCLRASKPAAELFVEGADR